MDDLLTLWNKVNHPLEDEDTDLVGDILGELIYSDADRRIRRRLDAEHVDE